MTEKQQQAIQTFQNGYNCTQSVLSVFAEDLHMNKNQALKIASPFGSGIAYMQDTCGAVTGALMAIGLKYGKGENGTAQDKERAYDLSRHFIAEFEKIYGTTKCFKLMNQLDMNTPEGMAEIKKQDLFRLHCAKQVQTAIEIVDGILNKVD